jgi:hypothetical protein
VKPTLVCFVVVYCFIASAQEMSPRTGENVNAQRLFKFFGTVTATHGDHFPAALSLHFAIYNDLDGGEAFWQETQNVRPDSQGRYTVLLGETTSGGLPADLFVSDRVHWLGVRASGQAEQPRSRLVDFPSALKSDSAGSSPPVSLSAMRNGSTERYLALFLLTMFLVGIRMAYTEVQKWRNEQRERYGEPPFVNPLNNRLCRARVLVRDRFSSIREHLQRPHTSIEANPEDVLPKKAA